MDLKNTRNERGYRRSVSVRVCRVPHLLVGQNGIQQYVLFHLSLLSPNKHTYILPSFPLVESIHWGTILYQFFNRFGRPGVEL